MRFKFPSNITWDELMSGGAISEELFQMSYKDYSVFGDSECWGKYVANDYKNPLDIVGFKNDAKDIFQKKFQLTILERNEIRDWLPDTYINHILYSL